MAAYIIPDPAGNFLKAFQIGDTSVRDQQRLELQRRQMEDAAVQRARDNKARDFNQMLASLNSERNYEVGLAEAAVNNEIKRAQLGISQQQANISQQRANTDQASAAVRERAYAQRQAMQGDPLGLGGSAPSAPMQGVPAMPMPDGEFGAGIDADVSSPDAPALQQLNNDLAQWESGALPATAVSPGPIEPLIDGPPPSPDEPQAALFPQSSPLPEVPAGPPEIIAPPAAQETALLPPPVLDVPAIGSADLTGGMRREISNLNRMNQELTRQEMESAAESRRIATATRQARPDLKPAYQAEAQRAQQAAVTASGQAQEAKAQADRLLRDQEVLLKRQNSLGALSGLEGVLPPAEQAALIADAGDINKGGLTDRRIANLTAYDKVRQAYNLGHQSRGLQTAEQVARRGLALETKDAQDWRSDARKAEQYRTMIEEDAAIAAGQPGKLADEELKTYRTELAKARVGESLWKDVKGQFDQAVRADTVPEAPVAVPVAGGAPVAAPAAAPVAPAATPAGIGVLPARSPEQVQTQQAANQFWNTGKQQASQLANLSQATDEELRLLASGEGPSVQNASSLGSGTPYSRTLADKIKDQFKMPEGGDRSEVTGRPGWNKVDVEDFLKEAAKEEWLRRRGGQPQQRQISEESRKKAANIKI